MQGTWCPLFPDLGVGWGSKAWGSKNLAPVPKAELGLWGPIWQQRNMAAQRRQEGEQQAGPPRSPEKRGGLKALTDTGAQGLIVLQQPGRGDALLPRATDLALPMDFVKSLMGRGLGLGEGQVLAPRHLTSSQA